MYSRISNERYREIPLADFPDIRCPNYVYSSVSDLCRMGMPKVTDDELTWCRTIGILQSFYGQFHVCEMNSTGGVSSEITVLVSVVYLKSPQYTVMMESLVLPTPVQIFGSIKWFTSSKKVLFIKIMQLLTIPKALQMKDVMDQLIVLKSSKGGSEKS